MTEATRASQYFQVPQADPNVQVPLSSAPTSGISLAAKRPATLTAVARRDDSSKSRWRTYTWSSCARRRRKRPGISSRYTTWDATPVLWLWEMLSLLLALLTLLAIVILLVTRHNRPQPDWPSFLQVNSLVAILSSIFKVALLYPVTEGISELKWIWYAHPRPASDFDRFDAASRGPWGSSLLLIKYPRNILAAFGALIVVVALAIALFTQQAVQFYSCTVTSNELAALIPRSNNYTTFVAQASDFEKTGLPSGLSVFNGANFKMQGAMYQGFLQPPANATAGLSPYCPSGNCTFPHVGSVAYSSLAICPEVLDISSQVTGNYDLSYLFTNVSSAWRLPSGLSIMTDQSQVLATQPTMPVHPNTTVFVDSAMNLPLVTFEILSISVHCNDSENCSVQPFAAHVALTPCVQHFGNVSVSGTTWQRQLLSSTPLNGNPDYGYSLAGETSSTPGIDCSPSPGITSGNKTYRITVQEIGHGQTVQCSQLDARCDTIHEDSPQGKRRFDYYNPACVFSVSSNATLGLTNSFATLVGTTMGGTVLVSPKYLNVGTFNALAVFNFLIPLWPSLAADPILQTLWHSGKPDIASVRNVTQGLVDSMNAVLATDGDSRNSEPFKGTVLVNSTCIHAAWVWLAFPMALWGLGVAFLTFTIFSSHKTTHIGGSEAGRRPWKSASAPLLWCGVQDAAREKYGSLDTVDEMDGVGDRTHVSLGRFDGATNAMGRWFLREHDVVPRTRRSWLHWTTKPLRGPFAMLSPKEVPS